MKQKKSKTLVQAKHIDLGIEKYGGTENPKIQRHLEEINWKYTVYQFEDGRVLLVYPDRSFGILYANENVLYQEMDKERSNNTSLDNLG